MEFRSEDVIINVDRKLNNGEECFIKGQGHFMMAVLCGEQAALARKLMLDVVVKLKSSIEENVL